MYLEGTVLIVLLSVVWYSCNAAIVTDYGEIMLNILAVNISCLLLHFTTVLCTDVHYQN